LIYFALPLSCGAREGNRDRYQVCGGKEVKSILLLADNEQHISSRKMTIIQDSEDKKGRKRTDINRKKSVRIKESSEGKHTKRLTNNSLLFPSMSRQGSECF